jgi:hypothetical protein
MTHRLADTVLGTAHTSTLHSQGLGHLIANLRLSMNWSGQSWSLKHGSSRELEPKKPRRSVKFSILNRHRRQVVYQARFGPNERLLKKAAARNVAGGGMIRCFVEVCSVPIPRLENRQETSAGLELTEVLPGARRAPCHHACVAGGKTPVLGCANPNKLGGIAQNHRHLR